MDREARREDPARGDPGQPGCIDPSSPSLDALVAIAVSVALIRDLMSISGLRHRARSLFRVPTYSLFTASSAAVMSTVVDFAMQAAHDRIAAGAAGSAGPARRRWLSIRRSATEAAPWAR